jgi:hypothetical protein
MARKQHKRLIRIPYTLYSQDSRGRNGDRTPRSPIAIARPKNRFERPVPAKLQCRFIHRHTMQWKISSCIYCQVHCRPGSTFRFREGAVWKSGYYYVIVVFLRRIVIQGVVASELDRNVGSGFHALSASGCRKYQNFVINLL